MPGYGYSFDGAAYSSDSLFTGLAVGNYTVIVRDDSACTDTSILTIQEPLPLSFAAQITDAACQGDSTGFAVITGSGGWGAYQLSIDGSAFANMDTLSGLAAGTYQVVIQDDSLCTHSKPSISESRASSCSD